MIASNTEEKTDLVSLIREMEGPYREEANHAWPKIMGEILRHVVHRNDVARVEIEHHTNDSPIATGGGNDKDLSGRFVIEHRTNLEQTHGDVETIAKRYGLSTHTIRKMTDQGIFPVCRLSSRCLRWPIPECDQVMKEHRIEAITGR